MLISDAHVNCMCEYHHFISEADPLIHMYKPTIQFWAEGPILSDMFSPDIHDLCVMPYFVKVCLIQIAPYSHGALFCEVSLGKIAPHSHGSCPFCEVDIVGLFCEDSWLTVQW